MQKGSKSLKSSKVKGECEIKEEEEVVESESTVLDRGKSRGARIHVSSIRENRSGGEIKTFE